MVAASYRGERGLSLGSLQGAWPSETAWATRRFVEGPAIETGQHDCYVSSRRRRAQLQGLLYSAQPLRSLFRASEKSPPLSSLIEFAGLHKMPGRIAAQLYASAVLPLNSLPTLLVIGIERARANLCAGPKLHERRFASSPFTRHRVRSRGGLIAGARRDALLVSPLISFRHRRGDTEGVLRVPHPALHAAQIFATPRPCGDQLQRRVHRRTKRTPPGSTVSGCHFC